MKDVEPRCSLSPRQPLPSGELWLASSYSFKVVICNNLNVIILQCQNSFANCRSTRKRCVLERSGRLLPSGLCWGCLRALFLLHRLVAKFPALSHRQGTSAGFLPHVGLMSISLPHLSPPCCFRGRLTAPHLPPFPGAVTYLVQK